MNVTTERGLTEFCVVTFDVQSDAVAKADFCGVEDFFEEESDEESAEEFFSWHETGESLALLRAHGPAFEHKEAMDTAQGSARNLGHIQLTREELRLEVTSRRRLGTGKESIAKHLGSALQARGDEIKSVEEALGQIRE